MKNHFAIATSPTNHEIGFVKADFAEACATLTDLLNIWKTPSNVRIVKVGEDGMITDLYPLEMPIKKMVLIPTNSEWVAYVDNASNGTDAESVIDNLTALLDTCGFILNYNNDVNASNQLPSMGFKYFLAEEEVLELCRRAVMVADQGNEWEFWCKGEPLDFEDSERYKTKEVSERLNLEMLLSYCHHFGIYPEKRSFFQNEAALFSLKT